jgi:hypothetical protein
MNPGARENQTLRVGKKMLGMKKPAGLDDPQVFYLIIGE